MGLLGGFRKKDPDQPKLSRRERIDLLLRGLLLSVLVVTPIASAAYFMVTQMRVTLSYPKGNNVAFATFYLGDVWDRLPIHIDNLLHRSLFAPLGTVNAPHTWVVARHDTRHVLIGFGVSMIIGALTIGLKERRRASTTRMVGSVFLAFILAMATTYAMIMLFTHVTPFVDRWGVSTNNAYIESFLGRGTLQLTVIGLSAGLAAKLALRRTFYTLQLMSLERKIAKGRTERWWWKAIYLPNYRRRFNDMIVAGDKGQMHNRWLGLVLGLAAPVLIGLLVIGTWLLNFGPAVVH